MSTRPRQPRRQGVVYGPLVHREQREPSSMLGRLLGAIVIVGALAVLGVGALAFLGRDGEPAATATPTVAAVASPTPTLSIAPTPTAPPTPTPSPTPTVGPSPSPTPFAIQLVEGPNKITFAVDYNRNPLRLNGQTVEFGTSGPIAWLANIGDPVGIQTIDFEIRQVNTSDLSETLVLADTLTPNNADARMFYAKTRVEDLVDGPGVYVMRYRYQGVTIAEGHFRVSE